MHTSTLSSPKTHRKCIIRQNDNGISWTRAMHLRWSTNSRTRGGTIFLRCGRALASTVGPRSRRTCLCTLPKLRRPLRQCLKKTREMRGCSAERATWPPCLAATPWCTMSLLSPRHQAPATSFSRNGARRSDNAWNKTLTLT